jgi:thiol:disulfide interchange protein
LKKMNLWLLILFLAAPLVSQMLGSQATKPGAKPAIFDPTRDAVEDIKQAVAEAAKSGKRVLVDVGGNWCIWCHEMERFLEAHEDLHSLRDRNYITVRVNWSPDNKNEAVLSKYPKIPGYPHLFVLDSAGALLHSQDTSVLEDGQKSYNLQKFKAFLKKWAPSEK